MGCYVQWSISTQRFLRRLPRTHERVLLHARGAVLRTARRVAAQARLNAPEFEGGLRRDLQVRGLDTDAQSVTARIGFSSATVMPWYESWDADSAPFHYPLGIEGPEKKVEPHKVYLFHVGRGVTPGRAKLIRWAKSRGIIPSDVPESGSEAGVRAALGDRPPWLYVSPPLIPFMARAFNDVGTGQTAWTYLADRVWAGTEREWRG